MLCKLPSMGAGQDIPATIKCGRFLLGRNYAASVLSVDPFEEISPYEGPVLIVHGTADRIVALDYAKKAQKAYNVSSNHCDLIILNGAGHGFRGKSDAAAVEAVAQFVRGRRNVLTIDVQLTGRSMKRSGLSSTMTLPFTGSVVGEWFHGKIQPGAADVQQRYLWKTVRFCADYILKGEDYAGVQCQIHIVNMNTGSGWKPTVTTDSEALSFLNDADCTATLENRRQGPVVRIYCE